MSRFFRVYDRLLDATVLLPGVIVALMALGISVDVMLRNAGLASLPWMLESVEYAMYGLTFVGTAAVLRAGRHVQVDLIGSALGPRGMAISDMIVALLTSVIAAILLWFGVLAVQTAFQRNAILRQYFDIPEWIVLLLLPFGWSLVLVECLRRLWLSARTIQGANQ